MMTISEGLEAPRLSLWRIGKRMLAVLIVPVVTAIIVDVVNGWWPLLTLIVAGFAFPIAGFLVIRTTMQELQRVISELAPIDPSSGADEYDKDEQDNVGSKSS